MDNQKEGYLPERQKQIDAQKGVDQVEDEAEDEIMEQEEEEEFDVVKEAKKSKK